MIKIPLLASLVLALLVPVVLAPPADIPVVEPTRMPTPIQPTSTSTPILTATPQRSVTPTNTVEPTLTPTPTMEPGVAVTAHWKVRRVLTYKRNVEWWLAMEKEPDHDFLWLTDEYIPLILAVMAAESGGDPKLVSSAGAIGLMQVIPRSWTASESRLFTPSINIYWGMYILDRSLNLAEMDLRYGLAYYNCYIEKVHNDGCGSKGGVHYADKILTFWLPLIEEGIKENDNDGK